MRSRYRKPMRLNSKYCIEQLCQSLIQSAAGASRAEDDARDAARTLATEQEKKEDSRAALEFGNLAKGQAQRSRNALQAVETLRALLRSGLPTYGPTQQIGMGAIVDVAQDDEEGAYQERSFVILPVGAGTLLTGPGGDGFLTVITPASPVGRALIGKREGDVIDVRVSNDIREWTITAVA